MRRPSLDGWDKRALRQSTHPRVHKLISRPENLRNSLPSVKEDDEWPGNNHNFEHQHTCTAFVVIYLGLQRTSTFERTNQLRSSGQLFRTE